MKSVNNNNQPRYSRSAQTSPQQPRVQQARIQQSRPQPPSPQQGSAKQSRAANQPPPPRRKPVKRGIPAWKVTLAVVVIFILVLIALGASYLKFYRPSVDTDVPFDIETTTPYEVTTAPTDSNAVVTGEDTETADDTEDIEAGAFTRDTESVNFLVVGRDAASWNTDVIMIVNFNMREGSLSVMQLPRDTYIEADSRIHGRINTVMKSMRSRAYDEDPTLSDEELLRAGMAGMCELLEKSLCIQIDGYAHVDLAGFRGIVDAIGGVYMDVPYAMQYSDPDQDLYINLQPGPQTLSGKEAEMFVRFRSDYVQADIGRIDAQKIFLTALFKQLKTNLTVTTVPQIVEQVVKYVTTDVPLADIIIYAKELLGVDMNNVSMMTLYGTATQTETGAWYYIMNRASTLDMINTYFNVYNSPITDEIFDRTQAFTDEGSDIFTSIYNASPDDPAVEVKPDIMTGEEIDNGDLDIALH